jgi:hypothetical protein
MNDQPSDAVDRVKAYAVKIGPIDERLAMREVEEIE